MGGEIIIINLAKNILVFLLMIRLMVMGIIIFYLELTMKEIGAVA